MREREKARERARERARECVFACFLWFSLLSSSAAIHPALAIGLPSYSVCLQRHRSPPPSRIVRTSWVGSEALSVNKVSHQRTCSFGQHVSARRVFVSLFVSLFVCLFVCLLACLFVCLFVWLFVFVIDCLRVLCARTFFRLCSCVHMLLK